MGYGIDNLRRASRRNYIKELSKVSSTGMTPYAQGYADTFEKLARGMFPSVQKLFQMGIKPGSGQSLIPFAKGLPKETVLSATNIGKRVGVGRGGEGATAIGKRMTQPPVQGATAVRRKVPGHLSAFSETMRAPIPRPISPRRLMQDVREMLRQRALQAGTHVAM